ncbi:endonuclease Q family protein [Bacillus sp. FJAT-45350]|uniref:endonuclease Q family protein n=1 Tax=Bacillus sp. FJAT-45350 TaxID=2011014 RepID=UPI000BB9994D|nr:endonuclease Q family protein [Bacillus sp. FJAT-45350]
MKDYYVDLHIHIGRTETNRPVKITAAKSLTLKAVLDFACNVKGLDCIGIIDCHVPEVISELEALLNDSATEHELGGIHYNGLTLFLGSELEVYDETCKGPIHVLVYFPYLEQLKHFSQWLKDRMKNISLSSQRIYEKGIVLQKKVKELNGLFIPAHVFTPHKSLYGKGVETSLSEVFDPDMIDAIELGLSSDTNMVQNIEELKRVPFLSNSDAHSLEKIAREYQIIRMREPVFSELRKALLLQDNRGVVANYGLDPRLGKYYFTSCEACFTPVYEESNKHDFLCSICGYKRYTMGVLQRIGQLTSEKVDNNRPPYHHQIPLEYIPKLGPKTLEKLRNKFGTDMSIIHDATLEELEKVCTKEVAKRIIKARNGELHIQFGGAGRYGKVEVE